ncbi:MAG: hypothetical protein IPJ77_13590 [Planctomycetes bacterium]|nr:hypothetical protein [Planctomycetota bacterium]
MKAAELPDGTRVARRVTFTDDELERLDAIDRERAWLARVSRERWDAGG